MAERNIPKPFPSGDELENYDVGEPPDDPDLDHVPLELKRWRLECGRPDPDVPIIGELGASGLVQWSWKRLQPTAKRVLGRGDISLYTLRHTHASACHYAGFTVPAAARRLGHSGPLHLKTYAHVIDALEGKPRYADLDALIAAARSELETPERRLHSI